MTCLLSTPQDVKTYTASCLSHVLRLNVEDCSYSSTEQQVGKEATQQQHRSQYWSCLASEAEMSHARPPLPMAKSMPAVLQGIFGLFLWVFRRLENSNAPSFQMCQSILDIVSQVLELSCIGLAQAYAAPCHICTTSDSICSCS